MHVEVITPRGAAFTGEVEEIVAQGALGEFGVLPGHIPFLTSVRPGVLRLRVQGGGERSFAVGAGFLQVGAGDQVVVLVDTFEKGGDVDVAKVQRELAELAAKLDKWEGERDATWAHLESQRAWAQARLDARGPSSAAATH